MSETDVIHGFAMRLQPGLLAIGGFGHSRLHEVVLSGVTRGLIGDASVPVRCRH